MGIQIHHHRFSSMGLDQLSPPQIKHLWEFQLSTPWIFLYGLCFSYLATINWTSMGILVYSTPWIFILRPLRLSPPQIFIYGPLRVSPPQIGIYGHFNCITIESLHLWAFQFNVQSQLFGLASKVILFSVQHLESVLSFKVTGPNILDHQHCTPCSHSFTFHHTSHFIAYVFLNSSSQSITHRVFPLSCMQHEALSSYRIFLHIVGQSAPCVLVQYTYGFFLCTHLFLCSLVVQLLLNFDIDFRVTFEDFSNGVWIHNVTLEAP